MSFMSFWASPSLPQELMQYLDEYMERYVDENGGHYNLNIDLSCNSYVTDNGVSSHLVPFLQKWPGIPG